MPSYKDADIDERILPLIKGMNTTGWIETVSCCEGRPGTKYFPTPYVAFSCRASKITTLCKILNATNKAFGEGSPIWLDLGIVFSDEVCGCQEDARRGWIALNLDIDTDAELKEQVFQLLLDGFKRNSEQRQDVQWTKH